jgi:hypothetical protein
MFNTDNKKNKPMFVAKPNTGFLFKNRFKKYDTHPDFRGDVYLDKELLELLMKQSTDNIVKIALSAYINMNDKDKGFITLYASRPYGSEAVAFAAAEDRFPF